MTLSNLIVTARDKTRFLTLTNYVDFCRRYLDFIEDGLQAKIISQNESHYQFFQYREDGHFNISRPINSRLMYGAGDGERLAVDLPRILAALPDQKPDTAEREILIRSIYTLQQSIGATLDALPAGASNFARKLNGDLFERLIQLLIRAIGISCESGTVQVPVSVDGEVQFQMSYQHDLLISREGELKIIGSVKTSSKDRIDKIFMDKFLYCKLTETALPHIAVFLNDVQRKATPREDRFGVNSTFLTGHFKAFTVKLNPLDGVYYCDLRPNMAVDPLLATQIRTVDHLFCEDLWRLLRHTGAALSQITILEEEPLS